MINNTELLVKLNQYSQGIRSIENGKDWFSSFSSGKQHGVLRELSNLILQAGANSSDVDEAIDKSGLKSTFTPCVLLKKENLKVQLSKVLSLPSGEYTKAFALFISLLSIADQRRRDTKCKNGCSHWWHQDLSNEGIVRQIIERS
jgi:hypothetical protein